MDGGLLPSFREANRTYAACELGPRKKCTHFDGEIEKFIRAGTIDLETGMAHATNAGNLRLELADFIPPEEIGPASNS